MTYITVYLIVLSYITGYLVFAVNDHEYDHCYSSQTVSKYNYKTNAKFIFGEHIGQCYKFQKINFYGTRDMNLLAEEIRSQCFTYEVFNSIRNVNFKLNHTDCLICFDSIIRINNNSTEFVFKTTEQCHEFGGHLITFVYEKYEEQINSTDLTTIESYFSFLFVNERKVSDLFIYFYTLNADYMINFSVVFIYQEEVYSEYSIANLLYLFLISCLVVIPIGYLFYQYLFANKVKE